MGSGHCHSRVVSASSSFLRFMRSFRASASRRAIWMRCWMLSALISAMAMGNHGGGQLTLRRRQGRSGGGCKGTAGLKAESPAGEDGRQVVKTPWT